MHLEFERSNSLQRRNISNNNGLIFNETDFPDQTLNGLDSIATMTMKAEGDFNLYKSQSPKEIRRYGEQLFKTYLTFFENSPKNKSTDQKISEDDNFNIQYTAFCQNPPLETFSKKDTAEITVESIDQNELFVILPEVKSTYNGKNFQRKDLVARQTQTYLRYPILDSESFNIASDPRFTNCSKSLNKVFPDKNCCHRHQLAQLCCRGKTCSNKSNTSDQNSKCHLNNDSNFDRRTWFNKVVSIRETQVMRGENQRNDIISNGTERLKKNSVNEKFQRHDCCFQPHLSIIKGHYQHNSNNYYRTMGKDPSRSNICSPNSYTNHSFINEPNWKKHSQPNRHLNENYNCCSPHWPMSNKNNNRQRQDIPQRMNCDKSSEYVHEKKGKQKVCCKCCHEKCYNPCCVSTSEGKKEKQKFDCKCCHEKCYDPCCVSTSEGKKETQNIGCKCCHEKSYDPCCASTSEGSFKSKQEHRISENCCQDNGGFRCCCEMDRNCCMEPQPMCNCCICPSSGGSCNDSFSQDRDCSSETRYCESSRSSNGDLDDCDCPCPCRCPQFIKPPPYFLNTTYRMNYFQKCIPRFRRYKECDNLRLPLC